MDRSKRPDSVYSNAMSLEGGISAIDQINDIEALEALREQYQKSHNYDMCAKITDRIIKLIVANQPKILKMTRKAWNLALGRFMAGKACYLYGHGNLPVVRMSEDRMGTENSIGRIEVAGGEFKEYYISEE